MATRQSSRAQRFVAGPWKGVRTTTDPLDDPPDLLVDATNLYIPDPQNASGAYARPGLNLLNGGFPLVTSTTPFRGQGAGQYTDLSGTTYNFCVIAGKLFRVDGTLSTFTDVSPLGITIHPGSTTRVYFTPFGSQFIITDGVNRPWLATNLSSTPITGTYIDYDGAGTTWSAYGPFRVYAGSAFCILNQVNNVQRRTDISWSAPADASLGWQQTNYDFNWTLLQTATDPLYALAATNTQLYYFRRRSIGSLSGVPGPGFQGEATHDAISVNVGTQIPQSIVQFGQSIYFMDLIGRPYRLVQGSAPDPIWLQMRGIADTSSTGFPAVTQVVATTALEPTLNLVITAPWSPIPSQIGPATQAFAFDAQRGVYVGRWQVGNGCQIETLGNWVDANGRGVLCILGSAAVPSGTSLATSGYVWSLNGLQSLGDYLTTEAGTFLTTEDGTSLTTEGTGTTWLDNGAVPVLSATTTRLGYDIDTVITVDRASALVGSTAPCQVSMQTAAVAQTLEGTPTPSTVQDGISRLIVGASGIQGRGVEVTVSPTTAATQWNIQRVTVDAVPSLSPPDEV